MEWLASVATLAERINHALKTRGKKAAALDKYLAERFQKKGTGTGYVHRILHRGQQPAPDVCAAIAEYLDVSLAWLLTGQGAMDRGPEEVATFDSLTGWAESAAVEVERGRVQSYAIRAAGRSPAFVRPVQVTPDFVFRTAMFWLDAAPEDERRAAADAEARRLRAEEDAKRRP